MKKLLQRAINWLRSRVTAIRSEKLRVKSEKVKSCVAAVNSDDVAGERLRDKPGSYPLPLRELPLSQRESANIASSGIETSNPKEDPLLLRIEEFIDEHYRVRLNLLSQQYEVSERGTERWTSVNGTLCNRILMELNRSGIILAQP